MDMLHSLAKFPPVRRRLARDLDFLDAVVQLAFDLASAFVHLHRQGSMTVVYANMFFSGAAAAVKLALKAASERPARWRRHVSGPSCPSSALLDLNSLSSTVYRGSLFVAAVDMANAHPDYRPEDGVQTMALLACVMQLVCLSWEHELGSTVARVRRELGDPLADMFGTHAEALDCWCRMYPGNDGCDREGCSFAVPDGAAAAGGLKKCSRCRVAWYCSVGCQSADWPAHKAVCFAADWNA
ncbi:hypothetical protein DFJ74DRAFT_660262 [Hyaloraphidium curvatum]|nr:hypothetical protein DFJ74DRAFT_660262 [Hyaloraphidium curvatum]